MTKRILTFLLAGANFLAVADDMQIKSSPEKSDTIGIVVWNDTQTMNKTNHEKHVNWWYDPQIPGWPLDLKYFHEFTNVSVMTQNWSRTNGGTGSSTYTADDTQISEEVGQAVWVTNISPHYILTGTWQFSKLDPIPYDYPNATWTGDNFTSFNTVLGCESCNVHVPRDSYDITDWGEYGYDEDQEHYSYTRTAQTTMALLSGGRAIPGRQILHEITGWVKDVIPALGPEAQPLSPPSPPYLLYTKAGSYPYQYLVPTALGLEPNVPNASVHIGGLGTLHNDPNHPPVDPWQHPDAPQLGTLYYVTAAGAGPVDCTPTVGGLKFYTWQLYDAPHVLDVSANNLALRPDNVRDGANHAIGEKINLSPLFVPGLPDQTGIYAVKWTLPGTYINAFTVWQFQHEGIGTSPHDNSEDLYDSAEGLTDFRKDPARLQWTNTFAWWLTGSTTGFETERIRLGMTLIMPNGQYIPVTGIGLIGMHQPTVSWNSLLYVAGRVWGQKVSGYGAYGLYKVGLLDTVPPGIGVGVTADSQSLVHGTFGITQLIKRTSFDPVGSWSSWELDGSMPYDNGDHLASKAYDFSFGSPGSARATLYDAPSVTGLGYAWSVDQFKDYYMFRADSPGSIWATLGTTDWNWHGSIVYNEVAPNGWVWTEDPHFLCQMSITTSHQHPEFQETH